MIFLMHVTVKRLSSEGANTFEQLILKYMDNLYGLAVRLTRNREEAKDLLQESCLTAYENFDQLREIEKIKPWLFRILHRKFINNYRRKKEPPLVDIELDENLLAASGAVFQPEHFEKLLSDEVQSAFISLPVEFREAIILADIEEFSYREIAEILDLPMGTVASRLYRGHSLLSEKLREYAEKHGYEKHE